MFTAADGREIMLAVASDGAGSAPRSAEGASMAVEQFLEDIGPAVVDDPELAFLDRPYVVSWLQKLRNSIDEVSTASGCRADDFACTFLAAVVGPTRTAYIQLGDGAIVVAGSEANEYSWVFWPQHGEFANSTNFVTQNDFESAVEVETTDAPVNEVAIFTDGIERLVLDMQAKTVHSPALIPIFGWLSGLDPRTEIGGPAAALVAFLGSGRVNDRTDDDKTLVMATRLRRPAAVN